MADGDDSDGNTTSEQEQQAEKERAEKDKAAERQAADEAKEIKRLRRASLILLASLVILGFASLATLLYLLTAAGLASPATGGAASTSTVTTTPQAAKQAAADPSPIPARAAAADPAATPTSGAATSVPPRPFLNLGRGMIPEWLQIAAPYLIATVAGFLGGCVAAAMSVSERRGNGWELKSGKQVPEPSTPTVGGAAARTGNGTGTGTSIPGAAAPGASAAAGAASADTGRVQAAPTADGAKKTEDARKKQYFNMRMAPAFLVRPFLGAAFGIFAYATLLSGVLLTFGKGTNPSSGDPTQQLAVLTIGFLFGLFSKTLHDKLRDGFKAFVNA